MVLVYLRVCLPSALSGSGTINIVDAGPKARLLLVYFSLGVSDEIDCVGCFVCRDFAEFYNSMHGNCFVFNSGWVNHTGTYASVSTRQNKGK